MDIRKSQLVKVETFVLLGRGSFATPTAQADVERYARIMDAGDVSRYYFLDASDTHICKRTAEPSNKR